MNVHTTRIVIVLFSAAFMAFGPCAGAQIFARATEELQPTSAIAMTAPAADRPVLAAIDGQASTSWGAPSSAAVASAAFHLPSARMIVGLRVLGHLEADSLLTVAWFDGVQYVPFFGGRLAGPINGEALLDISLERAVADDLLVTVTGPSAPFDYISELSVVVHSSTPTRRMLPPSDIVPGQRTSPFFSAEWLSDGDVRAAWRAGSWGNNSAFTNYAGLTDDDRDTIRRNAGRAAQIPRRDRLGSLHGHFPEGPFEGGVIFEYSENVSVERVKIYFKESARGDTDLQVETTSGWQTFASLPASGIQGGWIVTDLAPPVTGKRFKIVMSIAQGDVGDITEVEFWGTLADRSPSVVLGESLGVPSSSEALFRHIPTEKRRYALEVFASGTTGQTIAGQLNGSSVVLTRAGDVSGIALYQVIIDTADFEASELWLRIPLVDTLSIVSSRLRPTERTGEYVAAPGTILSDGWILTQGGQAGTSQWMLERLLSVDAIEVRGQAASSVIARVLVSGQWMNLSGTQVTPDLVIFPCAQIIGGLELTSAGPLAEVTLQGSPTSDVPPAIRIIVPDGEIATQNAILIGSVYDASTAITVNGLTPQRFGPYFAIRLRDADPQADADFHVILQATDSAGRVVTQEKSWYQWGLAPLEVDQSSNLQSTSAPTITVSGRTTGQLYTVVINGQIVSVSQNRFSVEVPVTAGFNTIVVTAKRKTTGAVSAVRLVHVIRYDTSFSIQMTSPVPGSCVSSASVVVAGRLTGAVEPVVATVNGAASTVQGNLFTTNAAIPLAEGANSVLISAQDGLGRLVSTTFSVVVDTLPPSLSFLDPVSGYVSASSSVAFIVRATDANPLSVSIDGLFTQGADEIYQATLSYPDGTRQITARATDPAGNSNTAALTLTVDSTPPLPFTVVLSPSGWTNNANPIASFEATDETSGIDHYEVSVDSLPGVQAWSPVALGPLTDGEHTILVTAFDAAGNARGAVASASIDTTSPPAPVSFRGIEGSGQVMLAWVSPADDVVQYRVERLPAWSGGPVLTSADTYVDAGLTDGDEYEYRVVAIDRAGNESPVATDTSMVGIAIAPVEPDEPATIVEFEGVSLFFGNESFPEGTTEIEVTTATNQELQDAAVFGMASPIMNFTATIQDETGIHQAEGVEFSKEFIGSIVYDDTLLPDGFPEENVGLYYWDTTWSKWLLVDKFAVDKELNTIVFATSHFTSFSVQPTMIQDLSPQVLKDVGYSPFKAQVTQGGITVSTQGGSAMTEATEFVLPGKAGFDFVLKRTYDAVTARGDSPGLSINAALSFSLGNIIGNAAELADLVSGDMLDTILDQVQLSVLQQLQAKLSTIFQNAGDYAYSTGVGWRLNLPYIRSSGGRVLVRTPSGAFYPVNDMSLKVDRLSAGSRKLILENHEGEDFTVVVNQFLTTTFTSTLDKNGDITAKPLLGWILSSATLIMKDGTQYTFDSLGRVLSMVDSTGLNTITFTYGGFANYFLDTITDSMGRVLKFQYEAGGANSIIPRITSITLVGDPQGRKVEYSYTDRTIGNGWNPFVPLLASATDAVGRTWKFGYDRTAMLEGGVSIKLNFLALLLETIPGLSTLAKWAGIAKFPSSLTISGHLSTEIAYTLGSTEGPGIGYNRITTQKRTFIGADVELTDYLFGFIPTGIQGSLEFPAQLYTSAVKEYVNKDGLLLKTTSYAYSFSYAGHQQIVNSRTVVNDGRTITTHNYEKIRKVRKTYLTVEDYLLSLGVIMAPMTYTEIAPYETSFGVATTGGTVLETTSLVFDLATMRPTHRTVVRGTGHSSSVSYSYDTWGNILSTTETTTDNAVVVSKTTDASYFIKPYTGAFTNTLPSGSPYDLPVLTRARMDLPLMQRIGYSVPGASNESQNVYFDYDGLGRKIAETAVVGGQNLETLYEYDGSSELSRVTSPVKSGETMVTSIVRDYTPANYYIVRTTKEGVELSTGASANVETVTWYDRFSGLKRFERDGRGYITSYLYDAIGRPTAVVKPADDDTTFSDPMLGLAFQSGNPTSTMTYDDVAFTVTVTGARGQSEVYDFDQAGRLASIQKTARELDANGQPIIANPQIQTTTVGYNGWGDITSIVDPNGKRTDYQYDAMGRLSGITYPADSGSRPHKSIVFDYTQNIQTTSDERGYVSLEYYDMAGRKIATKAYPDETGVGGRVVTTSTAFDGLGREATTVDELGGVTVKSYDERGNLIRVQTPASTFFENGVVSTYAPVTDVAYDDAGAKTRETLVTSAGSFETRYSNNEIGLPLSMERSYTDYTNGAATPAIAREVYGYDVNGNRVSIADANDGTLPSADRKVKTTTYSARGKVFMEVDRAGNTSTYAYDADDNQILMTDPRGNDPSYTGNFSAQFWYDDVNRLVKAIIPSSAGGMASATVSFQYDPRGNLLKRIDADGVETTYTYSARNKPLTDRRNDPGSSLGILTEHQYDASALEIETLVGSLYQTDMSYDGLSRLLKTTLPSGSYQELAYDLAGNTSRIEDGRGNATTFIYDSYKRLLVETDAAGHSRQLAYDARGNLTREIDANGNVRLMSYDELGRLIVEQRADGAVYRYAYDAVGNMTWSRDAPGISTIYAYTDDYHLASLVKTDGARTQTESFTWDRGGNRTSASSDSASILINQAGGQYRSDPYGRVRSEQVTIGGATFNVSWSYDEAGRVTQVGYPTSKSQGYRYDGIGQLAEVVGWTTPSSMNRDSAGKLLGYGLVNGVTVHMSWDLDGRLSQLGYGGTLPTYLFGYDLAGNMVSKNDNTYTYDTLERLVTADEKDWSNKEVHAIAGSLLEDYKGQGELVYGSGEVELKVDRASTSIGVDLGTPRELVELRLYPDTTTHRVKAPNLEVWVEEGGKFQKVVGVTTSVEAGSGTVVMRLNEPVISSQVKVHCLYDQRDGQDQAKEYAEFKNQASKLLEVRYRVQRTRESYSYDAKGNRTQVQTTTVEAPGAHTSTLTASYWVQTDRVKRYGEWTYVYDGNGNLVEKGTGYTEGQGFAADSGEYVRYDWDLFGRLEKVSRGETGRGSAVEVARYGYDADGLRVEKTVPGATGSLVTRWVYGPDGNVVLEQGESYRREYVYAEGKLLGYWELRGTEEQKYFTLTDQVGSVVSTTDESGVEVSKRDYLAFGTEAGAEGSAETVALYTGKEWDGEAGLYYYNARWYDAELGRFISEDPIKDQANWYAYVGNNPLTHNDPSGLLGGQEEEYFWSAQTPTWVSKTATISTGTEVQRPILTLTVIAEKDTWYKGDTVVSEDYTGRIWYQLSVDPEYGLYGVLTAGAAPAQKNAVGERRTGSVGLAFTGALVKEANLTEAVREIFYKVITSIDLEGEGITLLDVVSKIADGVEYANSLADGIYREVKELDLRITFAYSEASDEGVDSLSKAQDKLLPESNGLEIVSRGSLDLFSVDQKKGYHKTIERNPE